MKSYGGNAYCEVIVMNMWRVLLHDMLRGGCKGRFHSTCLENYVGMNVLIFGEKLCENSENRTSSFYI